MKIHIAGYPVKVGSLGRQLCAWCGVVLFDVDHARIAIAPGCEGGPTPWQMGELIAVDGAVSSLIPHEDGAQLPLNCCACPKPTLALVPEAAHGPASPSAQKGGGK